MNFEVFSQRYRPAAEDRRIDAVFGLMLISLILLAGAAFAIYYQPDDGMHKFGTPYDFIWDYVSVHTLLALPIGDMAGASLVAATLFWINQNRFRLVIALAGGGITMVALPALYTLAGL